MENHIEENGNGNKDEIHFVIEQSIPKVREGLIEEDINPLDNFRVTSSETAYVPELAFDLVDQFP